MNYKVPGVFVEEVSLFPPSVAAVATGIPAFIGYSEITIDPEGTSLINKPRRITSLLEYRQLFGGEYNPDTYGVQVNSADFSIMNITSDLGYRYYLFDCVRHYFDNGGGPCYIVTVGDYSDDIEYGSETTGLRGGLKSLEKVDEPTLLVAPDAVGILAEGIPDFASAGNLHQDMISQCALLQDRFAILDVMEGHQPIPTPINQFRNEVGTENLDYAATYYPWLQTTYLRKVYFTQLNFSDETDAIFDPLTGDATLDGLLTSLRARITEEELVFTQVTTAGVLDRSNYNPITQHFDNLRQNVLDSTDAPSARLAFSNLMTFVRELLLSFVRLENEPGISGELTQTLETYKTNTDLLDQMAAFLSFETNEDVRDTIDPGRNIQPEVENDNAEIFGTDWVPFADITVVPINGTDYDSGGGLTVEQTAQALVGTAELQTAFDTLASAYVSLVSDIIFYTDQAEKNLFTQHPFFKAVYEQITKFMSTVPPSGALAGVYAAIDRTRGVWKSPANLSLRNVVSTTYKLTDQEQGDLNVHITGKSVNALRAFTGKGIVVWGARTLAGNSNEWRYINVRRLFIFIEESIKKATEPFVFESNDANTWVRIRAMVENFLTIQWRQGALAGSTVKEAFFVKVGLNETMTALDILEGRLIVEIGMAAVRPAEFIILRFSHKMQES